MSKYITIPTCEECGEEVTVEEAYNYAVKLYNIDEDPKNKIKSINIMEQCARAGYAKAQNSIFSEYLSGEFIPQNIDAAFYWLEEACDQEYDKALRNRERILNYQ